MWVCNRCGCVDFSCDLENDWLECENCGLHSQNKDDIDSIADWVDYRDYTSISVETDDANWNKA
jgi:hypothetical protein